MRIQSYFRALLAIFICVISAALTSVLAANNEYDANGSLISSTDDFGNTATYTYNAKRQLVKIDKVLDNVLITISYTYDRDGVRKSKTVNGVTTRFVIDSNRSLPVIIAETDNDGKVLVEYTYGDGVQPISQKRMDTGERYFYHYDGQGNVRMLTDTSGNMAAEYGYDAFGKLLYASGNVKNNFLFSGQQYDNESGLYYHRARYMDPTTGRFTQMDTWQGRNRDPITLHKYLYSNADPVSNTDPSGKFSLSSISAGNTINAILTTMSVYSTAQTIGQFASGERDLTAKEIGIALIWAYAGSKSNILTKPLQKLLRKSGCLSNSFASETLVTTKEGFKRIDKIREGELVLSFNEQSGETEYQPVMAVIKNTKETELVVIELASGSVFEATPEHRIFADEKWIQAQYLTSDMSLKGADGKDIKVKSSRRVTRTETVYDLTVKKSHNFYITKDRVLVHNISPCEKAAQALAKAVPKVCAKNFKCKEFAREFEKLLLNKNVKGKRLCLKTSFQITSDRRGTISTNGDHVAVQVGEMVFDNLNPDGIPFSEWLDDLGGTGFIQPPDKGAHITLHEEGLGSGTKCK